MKKAYKLYLAAAAVVVPTMTAVEAVVALVQPRGVVARVGAARVGGANVGTGGAGRAAQVGGKEFSFKKQKNLC